MKNIYYIILLIFVSCSTTTPPQIQQKIPVDPYFNELALFLGGLAQTNGLFTEQQKKASYRSYQRRMDSYWVKIEATNQKIRIWSQEHLPSRPKNNTVLYLLSGGDVINAYNFYPDNQHYIFIGLEPPGKISDPRQLKNYQWQKGLHSMQSLLLEFSIRNYFTRKRMRRELSNPYFKGVTSLAIVFLSRLRMQIIKWQQVEVDSNGIVVAKNSENASYKGVKIFFKDKNGIHKDLTFLKMRISGNSMEADSIQGKFFRKYGRYNLIFKSAEYILQMKTFKKFIPALLAQTDMVIEDDSAIAYHDFSPSEWNIALYGNYIRRVYLSGTPPVDSQKDLIQLYKQQANPLPFHYGYGVLRGKSRSSLMVFTRKK